MSTLVVGVRMQADGSGLVGQLKTVKAELGGVATAQQGAAAAAAQLSGATSAVSSANDDAAEAFHRAAAAANENTASLRTAVAGAQQYAGAAAQLRAAIDPMLSAQQRFNQQLDTADEMLRAGVISEREYASAVALARQQLQEHAQAVAGSSNALNQSVAANDSASAALVRGSVSAGQAKAGYISLGRQMQDVAMMAAMPGVNLGTIITTQGGQIADAVAMMGGRFSGLASFLAGPWGAAIIVGTGLLVNLATSLLDTGDASGKAEKKSYDFAAGLDLVRLKSGEAADAMDQLSSATKSAIKVQGDFLTVMGQTATASVAMLEKRIADNQAAAQKIRDEWYSVSNLNPGVAIWNYRQIGKLDDQVASDKKALAAAKSAQTNAELAASQRKVTGELDAATAATNRYADAVGALETRYKASKADPIGTALAGTYLAQSDYEREFRAATVARDKALEAARKKTPKGTAGRQANFAQDTGTRIANIADQFSALPPAVVQANKALRDLEGIIGDVTRKGADAPKSAKLIADAVAAEAKVKAGLSKSLTDAIGNIGGQYSEQPAAFSKTEKSLKDIDAIIAYVSSHSKDLIDAPAILASARYARDAVENSLIKPFRDYMKTATEARQIDKLAVAGREDEAAALKVVLDLQKQQGPLSAEQANAVLETVKAQREMGLVLRDQRALVQANVNAVQSMRSALNETVANALKGRMSASSILASLGNSAVNIMSQRITESLFGNALRDLEVQAGDGFQTAMGRASTNVISFADAVATATARISAAGDSGVAASLPAAVASGTGLALSSPITADTLSSFAQSIMDASTGGGAANDNGDGITVKARPSKTDVSGTGGMVLGLGGAAAKGMGTDIGKGVKDAIVPVFNRLEKKLPDALTGAFAGNVGAKLILGSGSSGVGSSIGGAIGGTIGKEMGKKFVGAGVDLFSKSLGALAGPLGSVLGGVVGGMLGDLFTTSKRGTTVITSTSKDAATTASTSDVQAGLSNLSTSIQSSLDAIASKFSTTVGSFAVSIGQYKDYYRVSASGSSHVGDKYYPNSAGSDILYDGTDTAAAVMIAIQNAIKDGAIRGLSANIQKALASSSNIERAVAEALKVQEVELLIGGLGATMEKSFKDLDAKAAERVRIANDYGYDLLTVEKANAEKRLALQKSLLKEQVGSLQDLITEMTSGSLFEGSLVDQRNAILAQITAAKADVAAGKDGAGDALAKLLEQLNTVSKDVYGTAGNYAADRTLISDTARDAIASANAAIQKAADAAAASMTTADATATQLNEANDQLAKIATALDISLDYLKAIAANGNGSSASKIAKIAGY